MTERLDARKADSEYRCKCGARILLYYGSNSALHTVPECDWYRELCRLVSNQEEPILSRVVLVNG